MPSWLGKGQLEGDVRSHFIAKTGVYLPADMKQAENITETRAKNKIRNPNRKKMDREEQLAKRVCKQ